MAAGEEKKRTSVGGWRLPSSTATHNPQRPVHRPGQGRHGAKGESRVWFQCPPPDFHLAGLPGKCHPGPSLEWALPLCPGARRRPLPPRPEWAAWNSKQCRRCAVFGLACVVPLRTSQASRAPGSGALRVSHFSRYRLRRIGASIGSARHRGRGIWNCLLLLFVQWPSGCVHGEVRFVFMNLLGSGDSTILPP